MQMLRRALGLLLLSVMLLLAACSKSTGMHFEGVQGTAVWHVTLSDPPAGMEQAAIQAGLQQTLHDANQMIATWEQTSVISHFNQSQRTDWFAVPSALARVVALSLRLSEQSGGAYDVTLAPLLNVWGFGSHASPKDAVPDAAAIAAAQAKVGYQKLQVRLDPPALRKTTPELAVELASLADGFAADRMGEYLESIGCHHYMVEVAGEVRARGKSLRGDAWRIAIEKPLEGQSVVQQGVYLHDAGLATSGDYRHFFVEGGKRYSHTLDPSTGQPVTHNLASVSVMADSAVLADAYATLLMALGEIQGKAFAEKHGLKAYFIWRTDQGFATFATPTLQKTLITL